MSETLDSYDSAGTDSAVSQLVTPTALPLSNNTTASHYPTHVVLVLAVLAGLLILLAFNAAIWYWCLTHRYIRRASLQQSDAERAAAMAVGRPETAMSWGNTTRSISKLSLHETEGSRSRSSTLRAGTPLQDFMQWRWPTAIMKEDSSVPGASAESEKAIPPYQTVPAPNATPRPIIVTEPSSRSASPATVRAPRSFSPAPSSRAGTPLSTRAVDVDISAAYAMPYDSAFAVPLPSPPPPGGLTPPPPPRLTVRTAVDSKERGRRSPLSS